MSTEVLRGATPGPGGAKAAAILAGLLKDPLAGYLRLVADYGDTVRVPMSPRTSFFLLSRPEHAEHVLAVNQDNYVKAFTYRPLRALIGNGLLTSEGEDWRRHRRLVQPLFSRRDVRSFGPPMTAATKAMLKRWESVRAGEQIDVAAQLSALALDVVGRALFSADLTGDAGQMRRAMNAGQRVAVLATFAPLPWGPRSTRALKAVARRVGRTPEGIEGPVGRLIADRRGQLTGGAASGHRDLLDVLMAARREDGSPLTDTEISDEMATFMLAGHETSAVTMSWALALLSAFPQARVQLEEEVDTVLAGREPAAADADRLPWTTAVIAETMRLYPPAWTIERDAVGDDLVAGVPVPAGSTVAIPPYLVHRLAEFWPDPAGFDPARFLPVGQPAAAANGGARPARERHRYAYIPFGGGRRACIGQSFAELETVLVLAAIAQRFRLELTPAGIPRPTAAITLRPGRLPMRLLSR
ncbi:MAG: cytochrome P450 [Streptosporangiaceae bacterium]